MGRRNLSSSSTHSLYESKISLEVMSYTLFIGISKRSSMSMKLLLILVYQKNPFIKTCGLCETKNAINNLCLKDLLYFSL